MHSLTIINNENLNVLKIIFIYDCFFFFIEVMLIIAPFFLGKFVWMEFETLKLSFNEIEYCGDIVVHLCKFKSEFQINMWGYFHQQKYV